MWQGMFYALIAVVLVVNVVSFPYHRSDIRECKGPHCIFTKDYVFIHCKSEEGTDIVVTPPGPAKAPENR